MRALSLFSGIGGFDIAAEWCGFEVVGMVENDKFCQKVLKKHWPTVKLLGDIHDVKGDEFGTVDILYGGPPCQPASCAGKRGGTSDDRWLWEETYRIIRATKPKWIILENVRGILSLEGGVVFEELLLELESYDYETRTFCLPACSKNAPHRRDRVWIVAHTSTTGTGCDSGEVTDEEGYTREGRGKSIRQRNGEVGTGGASPADSHAPDTSGKGLQGGERGEAHGEGQTAHGSAPECGSAWQEPWLEASQRFCKLDARIPAGLDGCLTEVATHGIMGFILLLRRFHYAKTNEGSNQALSILREAAGAETVQKFFGRLRPFYEPEVLRCVVHGKSYDEREENESRLSNGSEKAKKEILRKLRDEKKVMYASQGYGLDKQCSCQFDDIVRELSSEMALGEWKNNAKESENILYHLWKESRGERFLHEPLPALYEIWRSVTDQEIGSFRRHYNKRNEYRVQKLKALGNAIVPQIAYEIMRAIKAQGVLSL